MRARLINSILCLIFASALSAQNSDAPLVRKYSNEFLSIGAGGRALGMANSCVATVSDQTAAYWNPAALTHIDYDLQLAAMHSEYFAGIGKYDYLGGAAKLRDSASLGFSLVRFGVDDIPNTLDLIDSEGNIRYDRITSFSVADYAFLISYAKVSAIQGLRYGGNAKVIRRKAGDFASAWGFGFDLSAQYQKDNLYAGIMAKDITSTFNAWKFNTSELEEAFLLTGNELPENSIEITSPKVLLGGAYRFEFLQYFSATTELGLDVTFDGMRNSIIKSKVVSADPHIGVEGNFRNIVFLRAGVGNVQFIPGFDNTNDFSFQPSIGLGLRLKQLSIDYAFTDIGDQSIALYSHIFSLSFGINKKE